MPSLSSPAPQGGNSADRARLSVGAEFFNLGASHDSRAKLTGEGISHALPSQTIAALGAQARDDLSNQITNSSRVIHAATDSHERQ